MYPIIKSISQLYKKSNWSTQGKYQNLEIMLKFTWKLNNTFTQLHSITDENGVSSSVTV